jgi:uncharacterized protein (TIGR03067 family)
MMVRTLALAVLLVTGAYCAGPASDDRTRLEGTWVLQAVEVNGDKIPLKDIKTGKVLEARLVIKGDQYLFYLGKNKAVFTHKMNPSATPKQIDLTVADGSLKGKTYRGIYRLEKDTYTICRNVEPGKDRPSAFATQPRSGLMMVVWKRLKT